MARWFDPPVLSRVVYIPQRPSRTFQDFRTGPFPSLLKRDEGLRVPDVFWSPSDGQSCVSFHAADNVRRAITRVQHELTRTEQCQEAHAHISYIVCVAGRYQALETLSCLKNRQTALGVRNLNGSWNVGTCWRLFRGHAEAQLPHAYPTHQPPFDARFTQ